MIKTIKRIKKYDEIFDLSYSQSLYLIYKAYKISFPITKHDLLELINLKILNVEGDFVENFKKLKVKEIQNDKLIIDEPVFDSNKSKLVYKSMLDAICFLDPVTKAPITINPSHFDKTINQELKEARESTERALKGHVNYTASYNLYLSLFPTSTTAHNKRWVAFYKVGYSGVNLRIRGRGNAGKFMQAAKVTDMGVLLYATFLFVSNGIQGKKTYIGSQTRFFDELDEWVALATLEFNNVSEDDYTLLFKKKLKSKDFKGGINL